LKLPKTFIGHLDILKVGYLNHGVDLEALFHVQLIIIVLVIFALVISALGEIQLEADGRVLLQCVNI
jgi:hypothetical protein